MAPLELSKNDQERELTENEKTMSSGFTSLNLITAACHGILNTHLVPPEQKPEWFDELKDKLDTAKIHARHWIEDLAVEITASIPKHVIDYGTLFTAITDEVLRLLHKKETPESREKIRELMNELRNNVGEIISEVVSVQAQLKKWGSGMEQSHNDLSEGVHSIQATISELEDDIAKLHNDITALYAKIDAENIAMAAGGVAIGVGIFALCCGIALCCVATPWTIAGGVVVGVAAVGAVIGGVADMTTMGIIINNQLNYISKDLAKIDDENLQIVTLSGLATSTNSAINYITEATKALDSVRTMWKVFEDELQGVDDKLAHSQESAKSIIKEVYIHAARNEWNQAVEFAQQLAGLDMEIKTKEYKHVG